MRRFAHRSARRASISAPYTDSLSREIMAHVIGQVSGGRIAMLRFLLQAFQTNGLEVAIYLGLECPGTHGFTIDHLPQHFERNFPHERRPAREQFIENGPQRVDVGGRA
jgi:hypothetical protein